MAECHRTSQRVNQRYAECGSCTSSHNWRCHGQSVDIGKKKLENFRSFVYHSQHSRTNQYSILLVCVATYRCATNTITHRSSITRRWGKLAERSRWNDTITGYHASWLRSSESLIGIQRLWIRHILFIYFLLCLQLKIKTLDNSNNALLDKRRKKSGK